MVMVTKAVAVVEVMGLAAAAKLMEELLKMEVFLKVMEMVTVN